MKHWIMTAAALGVLSAGCDRVPEPKVSSGDRVPEAQVAPRNDASAGGGRPLPSSPSGRSGATKPDPGDANDHSNPQHDARQRSG